MTNSQLLYAKRDPTPSAHEADGQSYINLIAAYIILTEPTKVRDRLP